MATLGTNYKPISEWRPSHGDLVIWHGWLTHWYGTIVDIVDDVIHVARAGLPLLLMQLSGSKLKKSIKEIDIDDIIGCKPGEYAVLQFRVKDIIWYV